MTSLEAHPPNSITDTISLLSLQLVMPPQLVAEGAAHSIEGFSRNKIVNLVDLFLYPFGGCSCLLQTLYSEVWCSNIAGINSTFPFL